MGGPLGAIAQRPNLQTPSKTEGGQTEITVSDDNQQSLLERQLKELKKMNLQMMIMTDTHIRNSEVE